MTFYTELNNVTRRKGLKNPAGPSYSSLEPLGTKSQVQPTASAEKQSNAKWQTIYPGIAVSVTVEGPYQSIRHFVRDLETNRQFLIINAVELETVTQSWPAQSAATQEPSAAPPPTVPTPSAPAAPSIVAPPAGGRARLL